MSGGGGGGRNAGRKNATPRIPNPKPIPPQARSPKRPNSRDVVANAKGRAARSLPLQEVSAPRLVVCVCT